MTGLAGSLCCFLRRPALGLCHSRGSPPRPSFPQATHHHRQEVFFKIFLLEKIKTIFHNSYAQQTQPGSCRDTAVFALCLTPSPPSGTPHPSLSTHSQCPVHISGLPDTPDPAASSEVYVTAVSLSFVTSCTRSHICLKLPSYCPPPLVSQASGPQSSQSQSLLCSLYHQPPPGSCLYIR